MLLQQQDLSFLLAIIIFLMKIKKKSYRSIKLFEKRIIEYTSKLQTLESNTDKIIEYVENTKNKDKKKYKFWELLFDDKKQKGYYSRH